MTKLKKFIPVAILLGLMLTASFFIDKQTILNQKDYLINLSVENLALSVSIFAGIYIISVALSLPIATVLTLLAGVIYGPILGTLVVVIGATIGALIIFLIIKKASGSKGLLEKYSNSKHLLTLQKNIKENAISYLLFARLVPVFPFVLVNIAPATVGVKTKTFLWTTFVGIIPGSFIYTYLGFQSGQIESVNDLVSTEMISALVLLGLFSLSPILIKKIKNKGVKNV
tara:strand:- start:182 stop:865 length:684 start_codon:yes stop_codon:yes gene_type:complete